MSNIAPSGPHSVLWQRVEGGLLFAIGMALFLRADFDYTWCAAFLIFFAPDLSLLGYVLGPRVGASCYNAAHLYAFGAAVSAAGLIGSIPHIVAMGALWVAHAGFDRMLGYGLKSPNGFRSTHLGIIGR